MVPLLQIKYCKPINVGRGKGKMCIANGKEFTTNGAENANSQIKAWCNEELLLDEFITKLRD